MGLFSPVNRVRNELDIPGIQPAAATPFVATAGAHARHATQNVARRQADREPSRNAPTNQLCAPYKLHRVTVT